MYNAIKHATPLSVLRGTENWRQKKVASRDVTFWLCSATLLGKKTLFFFCQDLLCPGLHRGTVPWQIYIFVRLIYVKLRYGFTRFHFPNDLFHLVLQADVSFRCTRSPGTTGIDAEPSIYFDRASAILMSSSGLVFSGKNVIAMR